MHRRVDVAKIAGSKGHSLCISPLTRGLTASLALLAVVVLASVASAVEEPDVVEGIAAIDVVRHAILEHPEVKMQEATVSAAQARLQERRGAFDVTLSSSVTHVHTELAILSYEQPAYLDNEALQSERTSWRLGAHKTFDFGLRLETGVEVERSEQVGLWPSAGRARVAMVASQALLRGRGAETGAGALESVAERGLEAAKKRLRHVQAQRALSALSAYWSYVALHQRFEILKRSEARAEALLAEVTMLIDNDERPAAEAIHFKSLLADRQAARTAVQVQLVGARQSLGLAMGLNHDKIDALPAPKDALPRPSNSWSMSTDWRDRLGEQGVAYRADLAASKADIKAAQVLVRAAERDIEPRLDLQLTFGYSGLEEGEGAETLITPIAGRIGGPDVGLLLDFAWPIQNRALRGRLARERALLERAEIAVDELERTVRAEIAAAADSLNLELSAYAAAQASVALHEESVLNQRRRLRSELTTAIDVLITEERLTGARLAALASTHRYAQGLTRLRFASASLLPSEGAPEALGEARLNQPPEPGQD